MLRRFGSALVVFALAGLFGLPASASRLLEQRNRPRLGDDVPGGLLALARAAEVSDETLKSTAKQLSLKPPSLTASDSPSGERGFSLRDVVVVCPAERLCLTPSRSTASPQQSAVLAALRSAAFDIELQQLAECSLLVDSPPAHFRLSLDLRQLANPPPEKGFRLFAEAARTNESARARWYDARNASWLSEDPAGAVDSPSLYAFVGQAPNMSTDPRGLCLGMNETSCWETAKSFGGLLAGVGESAAAAVAAPVSIAVGQMRQGASDIRRDVRAFQSGGLRGFAAEDRAIRREHAQHAGQTLVGMIPGVNTFRQASRIIQTYEQQGSFEGGRQLGRTVFSLGSDVAVVYGAAETVQAARAGGAEAAANPRHAAQVGNVEELDALVQRLGDRALSETKRAGLSDIEGGAFAEDLFGRYVEGVNKRLARHSSQYTIEWQPATLPGTGRVPAFVEYPGGRIGAYPGSLRLDAAISDTSVTVTSPGVSADTYPLILRGYDITIDMNKQSAVTKYTGPFNAPVRDIRPR